MSEAKNKGGRPMKGSRKRKIYSIGLDPDHHDWISRYAAEEGISRNDAINHAISVLHEKNI